MRSVSGSEMASAIWCCQGHNSIGPGDADRPSGNRMFASIHSLSFNFGGGANSDSATVSSDMICPRRKFRQRLTQRAIDCFDVRPR